MTARSMRMKKITKMTIPWNSMVKLRLVATCCNSFLQQRQSAQSTQPGRWLPKTFRRCSAPKKAPFWGLNWRTITYFFCWNADVFDVAKDILTEKTAQVAQVGFPVDSIVRGKPSERWMPITRHGFWIWFPRVSTYQTDVEKPPWM